MFLSLNWLKDYIDLPKDISSQKLADDLTMSTVEVESVVNQAKQFDKMVVGKIVELKSHPNADKLKIAMTDIGGALGKDVSGSGLVQIVCGGTNLKENMIVPVALPGAKVKWHGQGEPVVLEEAKIRGEKSFGMICASNEIGIESRFPCGEMEITDLSKMAPSRGLEPTPDDKNIGEPLAQALGLDDVIIEIDNKSLTNRPDLWSHYGIAREISAIYKTKLKDLNLFDKLSVISDQGSGNLKIKILDKNLCSRYIGCVVKNIKIQKSPDWLIKRLEAVGMRAINNIVDITNYVMQDVGEPTHAFDRTLINTNKNTNQTQIIIRKAVEGEKIQSLDGEERKLDKEMLIIADEEKPIAIAGIMGGANSEVSEKTIEIILEAASFNAMLVRKTSQKLGLRTEASIRFEKNLDSNLAETAMLRMLYLIKKIVPNAEIAEYIDEYPVKRKTVEIDIEHSFIEKRIGQKFEQEEVIMILQRLGFVVETENKKLRNEEIKGFIYKILVPSWRATGDVSIPEDIVEEVARIYGYDNLTEKIEMIGMDKAKYQLEFDVENRIKNYLSLGCGINEVFNYPWTDEKILKSLGILENRFIEIVNPPAQENRFLQTSLIPNLIKNVQDNLRYFSEFKLFELARVFRVGENKNFGNDVLPEQPKMLAGVVVDSKDVFIEIKGIVENLLKDLRFTIYDLRIEKDMPFLDQNKFLQIFINDEEIGYLGILDYEKISAKGGPSSGWKNKAVGLFEIDFSMLVGMFNEHTTKYKKLPQFPSIERDIAIEVEYDIKWGKLRDVILSEAKDPVIKEVSFLSEFDLQGKKSLAFRIIYQADRTLKDSEVEKIEQKIIKLLKQKFGAELRS